MDRLKPILHAASLQLQRLFFCLRRRNATLLFFHPCVFALPLPSALTML